jgi:multisubunit Na+/H+ antiporter MnhB subunit
MPSAQPNLIGVVIAAVIVVLILSFRMRRMRRSMPLRWKRLWIPPTILMAIAAITLTRVPLRSLDWAWLALALLVGAALGWQRGRLMTIAMDPTNRTLTTQATPMAIYFLLGLIVVRLALRTGLGLESQNGAAGTAFINALFVLFAAGLFMAQGLEMTIRARRLLSTGGESGDNP